MARTADPNLRDNILAAARAVFAAKGYADARLSDIAEKAGIATASIYAHFEGKEDIAIGLGEQLITRIYAAALPELANLNVSAAIAGAVHAAFEASRRDRDLLQLVHLQAGLLARAKLRPLAVRTRLHGQLQDLLEARMKAGLIRRYDPAILARLISGFVEYTAEACLVWGDGDVAPFEKTLIDLLRNALLPAPRRPGQRLVATLRARHTHPSKP
ncbi:MAG: TetR/AcrR family transcriptional regulator [Thermoflexales bacterium]|nr:TetR/AcrR family transcriptional regulator [Thermoflexales bacterium]